jgi:hypothetical protein
MVLPHIGDNHEEEKHGEDQIRQRRRVQLRHAAVAAA